MKRLAPSFVITTGVLSACQPTPPAPMPAAPAPAAPAPAATTATPASSAALATAPVPSASASVRAAPAPAPKPQVVVVRTTNPPMVTHIMFEAFRTSPVVASEAILDEVAKVLKQYPEITKLLVEGHADPKVAEPAATRVAAKRAEDVRKRLIARGIAPSRLVAKGVSSACPLAKAPSPQNRRVSFHILERKGKQQPAGCKP